MLEDAHRVLRFAQVIEGPAESLALVLDRIRADPRHTDLQVVLDGPAAHRRFARWDMAIEAVPSDQFEDAADGLMSA